VRRLSGSDSVSPREFQALESSSERFATLISPDNQKTKVTQFFSEAQTFCDHLIDKILRSAPPSPDRAHSVDALLQDSESDRIKLQNRLHRLESRLEESRSVSDQLTDEHFALSQLTAKLFPSYPYRDGPSFVPHELSRLDSLFESNRQQLTDFRSKTLIIDSILTQYAAQHNLHLTGDSVIDLKSALSFSDVSSASHPRSSFHRPTGKRPFSKCIVSNGRSMNFVTSRDRRN
jgi:hypothetical protein